MTSTAEPGQSELDMKKQVKEIPVIQDQGCFTFETGDTYDGFFEAKKKDLSVKMHGAGIYTTAEGDIYIGVWSNDQLGANEDVTISYTEGSRYEGLFREWCYNSRGKYYYPDGSLLQCDFVDNSPIGKLKLTDPNGHTWLGAAEQGFGWFTPVNHYFEMLETTRECKSRKHKTKELTGPGPSKASPASTAKKGKSPAGSPSMTAAKKAKG